MSTTHHQSSRVNPVELPKVSASSNSALLLAHGVIVRALSAPVRADAVPAPDLRTEAKIAGAAEQEPETQVITSTPAGCGAAAAAPRAGSPHPTCTCCGSDRKDLRDRNHGAARLLHHRHASAPR